MISNVDGLVEMMKFNSKVDAMMRSHNFKPKGHNKEIFVKSKAFRNQKTLRRK